MTFIQFVQQARGCNLFFAVPCPICTPRGVFVFLFEVKSEVATAAPPDEVLDGAQVPAQVQHLSIIKASD